MKKILTRIVVILWQLPQILLALLIIVITKSKCVENENYKGKKIYRFKKSFISGVSLGEYIILRETATDETVHHEYGHCRQSLYFGPLYLLVIGFPSAIGNNLFDRIFHKNWSHNERIYWYYRRFPEQWADKLGGVNRLTSIK
jgi:hypothetical protein